MRRGLSRVFRWIAAILFFLYGGAPSIGIAIGLLMNPPDDDEESDTDATPTETKES